MSKEKRYLITTADERTWKFDRPVIFLGEWCRIYKRRHVWQHMDAIVAAPYGLGLLNKDADYAEARMLEDKLLPVLCGILNQYHGVQHSERFCRIVFGQWLRRYVDVVLNRSKTLENCLSTHIITGTTVYANTQSILASQNSYSSIIDFSDDFWNNAVYARILYLQGKASFPVELIEGNEIECSSPNATVFRRKLSKKILMWGYQQVGKLTKYLVRDTDAFIINSYLPKSEELKLQLALGQCPQLWESPKSEGSEKPNLSLRKSLGSQINSSQSNNLESILETLLFELLPICYLEGFAQLKRLADQKPWPKAPQFILTSNNFSVDDIFNLWTATKIETGSKYFIGQHGNNYGTYRYMHPAIEEIIPDKFLTWGWTDGLQQHIPAFIFKTAGQKTQEYNPFGGLLLIELHLNHRFTTWDATHEFAQYFEAQQEFVANLASDPKKHLTIRLHGSYKSLTWNEDLRWQAYDPSIKIETGEVHINDLIAQTRLVVHSYDSTGILETLSQNIPTLAFWQNGFDHLRDSAKPYYQLLFEAGIVHFTPESIAQKVNKVWHDVDDWWSQREVQHARVKFCNQYAKVSEKPIRELRQIITNIS